MIVITFATLLFTSFYLTAESCFVSRFTRFILDPSNSASDFMKRASTTYSKSLQKGYGFSKSQIEKQLLSNFNNLPEKLQSALLPCLKMEKSKQNCERLFGKNKCQSNEIKGNFELKCKEGFIQGRSNLCVKVCKEKQIVISNFCQKQPPRYLDVFNRFNVEKQCLNLFAKCEKSKSDNLYIESCDIHERKLSFMCLTKCLDEFSEEELTLLRTNSKYCIQDQYYIGSNLYEM